MELRPDLRAEEPLLRRLAQYAEVFRRNSIDEWSHYKNQEDFSRVYHLDWPQRGPLEKIYGDGRDIAVFMGGELAAFNDPGLFPTLKSFVDSFVGGWVDQIGVLRADSDAAKKVCDQLESRIWAVDKMLLLFDRQIEILDAVRVVLNQLRGSETYRWESEKSQITVHSVPYEHVLACIDSIGKMFERLPATYAGKGEEPLRDHILVTLGAAMIGSATGETFNKRGKTDILVRSLSGVDNEFVGECKFWRGEIAYHATLDQLLSYLGWRDDKAAVILFVERQGFSSILQKIQAATPNHPSFVGELSRQSDSWINYEFRLPSDPHRRIRVAVMAYHLA